MLSGFSRQAHACIARGAPPRWRTVFRFVPLPLAVTIAGSLPVERAVAHGPCRCVFPEIAEPGQKLRLNRTTAYKVIFNPTPAQLATSIPPDRLASAYRPDAPSPTVFSLPPKRARRGVTFRVPDTTPAWFGLCRSRCFGGLRTRYCRPALSRFGHRASISPRTSRSAVESRQGRRSPDSPTRKSSSGGWPTSGGRRPPRRHGRAGRCPRGCLARASPSQFMVSGRCLISDGPRAR